MQAAARCSAGPAEATAAGAKSGRKRMSFQNHSPATIATSRLWVVFFWWGSCVPPVARGAFCAGRLPTYRSSAQLPGASPDETMAAQTVATPWISVRARSTGVADDLDTPARATGQITLQFDRTATSMRRQACKRESPPRRPIPKNLRHRRPTAGQPRRLAVLDLSVRRRAAGHQWTITLRNITRTKDFQIPGVARFHRRNRPAVRVQIDPIKRDALGLQMEDVARRHHRAATVDARRGSINGRSAA